MAANLGLAALGRGFSPVVTGLGSLHLAGVAVVTGCVACYIVKTTYDLVIERINQARDRGLDQLELEQVPMARLNCVLVMDTSMSVSSGQFQRIICPNF